MTATPRERLESAHERVIVELEERTDPKKLKHMSLDELNGVMKSIRENIKALAEVTEQDPSKGIVVVTKMPMEEKAEE